ncbi:MAG: conjugative transposon protein TraM [Bacteroidota bacterium]
MKLTKLSFGLLLSLLPICLALILRTYSLSAEKEIVQANIQDTVKGQEQMTLPISSEQLISSPEPISSKQKKQNSSIPSPEKSETRISEGEKKSSHSPQVATQEAYTPNPEPTLLATESSSLKESQEPPQSVEVLEKEFSQIDSSALEKESSTQEVGFNASFYGEQVNKEATGVSETPLKATSFYALLQGKKVSNGELIQLVLQEDIPAYSLVAGTYLQAECEIKQKRLLLTVSQANVGGRIKRIQLVGYDATDGKKGIAPPNSRNALSAEWQIPHGYAVRLRFK